MARIADCLNRRSADEIAAQIKQEISAELCDGAELADGHVWSIAAGIFAGALFEVSGDMERTIGQNFLSDMCCDQLEKFAAGIELPKQAARKAQGYVQLTGSVGAVVPPDLELTADGGLTFELDTSVYTPTELDNDGSALVYIASKIPGEDQNVAADATLIITNPSAGMDTTTLVTSTGLAGGREEEGCEQLRARLQERQRNTAVSGNQAFYRQIIGDYPGVERVCISGCACDQCCDSALITTYVFFGDDVFPPYGVPSAVVAKDIQDVTFGTPMGGGYGKAPLGAHGLVLCAKPSTIDVIVHCTDPPSPAVQALMRASVETYLSALACVGEQFCISDIDQTMRAVAPSLCINKTMVRGDDVSMVRNCAFAQMGCGKFPVLGALTFSTAAPNLSECS